MPRRSSTSPPIREFELVVLLAVLGLRDEAYPVSIRDAIEDRTRRKVSRAAVFITLERLEAKGFVRSEQEAMPPGAIGLPRRLYHPTPLGERVLRAWSLMARELVEGSAFDIPAKSSTS